MFQFINDYRFLDQFWVLNFGFLLNLIWIRKKHKNMSQNKP